MHNRVFIQRWLQIANSFLASSADLLKPGQSDNLVYRAASRRQPAAGEVEIKVAAEYERMGSAAYMDARWHDAYHYWYNALRINPNSRVSGSFNSMITNARDVYRDAYRLETVDIERAKQLWEKVLILVPRENEYYVKAAAKLEWYAHLQGSRE